MRFMTFPLLILLTLLLYACDLRDKDEDCVVFLEFRFDYNMEYADSFQPQVKTVDVLVFDVDDTYLFTRHALCEKDLLQGRRMIFGEDIPFGTYKILTIGNLTEKFRITGNDGRDFVPGVSRLQDFKLSLNHATEEISHSFAHLWFGEPTLIQHRADRSVWPIYVIRNTNIFHLLLHDRDATSGPTGSPPDYSFKIIKSQGTSYGSNNLPLTNETTTYLPYELRPGSTPGDLAVAKINTLRLFDQPARAYHLEVFHTKTLEVVGNFDLVALLEKTKPELRPDGTILPLQEFLDRQSEWEIVFIYGNGGTGDDEGAYLALYIQVNGMIVWEYDIEV